MSRAAFAPYAAMLLLSLAACSRHPSTTKAASSTVPEASKPARREIHITGVVQAIRSNKILVPAIQGSNSQMTLTYLAESGARVKEGDVVAAFDPTQQMDAARDAKAKFEDLSHQVDQKIAENRANAESRAADMRQAEANLVKARLELSKESVLALLERSKAQIRAAAAAAHLESLKKSHAFREKSEGAALRIVELQRDRQKIYLQRAQDNISKLEIRAPLAGMVGLEFTIRSGSLGRAQIGDQIYRTYPLMSIFDPSEMQVRCSINESDILSVQPGTPATVTLDAYPNVAIPAHYAYASPVASAGLGTTIKSFQAVFRIDRPDPRLLPDLSAAVVVAVEKENGGAK